MTRRGLLTKSRLRTTRLKIIVSTLITRTTFSRRVFRRLVRFKECVEIKNYRPSLVINDK